MVLGLLRFTNVLGGTADFIYPGPTTDMQSPASAGAVDGTTYLYYAQSFDMSQWEIGTGAYSQTSKTFARTAVSANSLGTTAKVNFTDPPQIFVSDTFAEFLKAAVTSIAGNQGAFTLNATSGITNAGNDIELLAASATQFGAVKVDGTTITESGGVISAVTLSPNQIHASLGADVLLNNTANYFDGPSIAQGTTGTWFVSGSITVFDASGAAYVNAKLWDGTTVIASTQVKVPASSSPLVIALSGYITSPAGNLRISAQDATSPNGKIFFNQSGNSKDSTISAYRIA